MGLEKKGLIGYMRPSDVELFERPVGAITPKIGYKVHSLGISNELAQDILHKQAVRKVTSEKSA